MTRWIFAVALSLVFLGTVGGTADAQVFKPRMKNGPAKAIVIVAKKGDKAAESASAAAAAPATTTATAAKTPAVPEKTTPTVAKKEPVKATPAKRTTPARRPVARRRPAKDIVEVTDDDDDVSVEDE